MQDYRDESGIYDAVVSCEMIEAVGKEYLEQYFSVIQGALKPNAKAVIQAITIRDSDYNEYARNCDWIQKHIFPGGTFHQLKLSKQFRKTLVGLKCTQSTHLVLIMLKRSAFGRKNLIKLHPIWKDLVLMSPF